MVGRIHPARSTLTLVLPRVGAGPSRPPIRAPAHPERTPSILRLWRRENPGRRSKPMRAQFLHIQAAVLCGVGLAVVPFQARAQALRNRFADARDGAASNGLAPPIVAPLPLQPRGRPRKRLVRRQRQRLPVARSSPTPGLPSRKWHRVHAAAAEATRWRSRWRTPMPELVRVIGERHGKRLVSAASKNIQGDRLPRPKVDRPEALPGLLPSSTLGPHPAFRTDVYKNHR